MLMYDPGTTPYDLSFRIFRVDVRVHPMFWLVSAIFGWPRGEPSLPGGGLGDAAVFVVAAFLSILLHELGHVWMGWAFGSRGHILLQGMGGLAIGSADVPHRWQRILVSAAGPGIQLALFGLLVTYFYSGLFGAPLTVLANVPLTLRLVLQLFLSDMVVMNLIWPILNLLPIWPLDGGWICREVCQIVSARGGLLASLWVSLITAVLFATNALIVQMQRRSVITIGLEWMLDQVEAVMPLPGWARMAPLLGVIFSSMFMGIFFALFAVTSWQAIQEETARRRRFWDDDVPWER